jgi:predicted permease
MSNEYPLPLASPASVGFSTERLDRLDDAMQEEIDAGHYAGISVMVARHGKLVKFRCYGYQALGGSEPLREDAIYRIASMTKPIIAVAMLLLYEEGRWQLDDPVTKFIPEFAGLQVLQDGKLVPLDRPMTMRHLMASSAGFAFGPAFGSTNPKVDEMYAKADLWSGTNGVLTSYGALALIRGLLPQSTFPSEAVIRINLPVLCFSVTVALGTGVLFGLWPALQLSRTHIGQIMQSGAHRVAGSVRGRRAHSMLIAAQVALTLLLLAAAGSSMKGFAHLLHQPLGYDPHNVMAIGIPLRESSYHTWPARAAYFEQLREKVATTSGVTTAAISTDATPPRNGWIMGFEILGKPVINPPMGSINLISPEYFAALRIPLLQGRIWSDAENSKGAHIAVINRTLAQRYFPNGDAIGHSLKMPGIEGNPATVLSPPNIGASWLQIVGIAGDARNDGLRSAPRPAVYVPFTLSMTEGTEILVHSQPPSLTVLQAVREQLRTINPDQQTSSSVDDLETRLTYEPEWQQEHLAAWIFGVFAWLALALAAVGLHSVVSYTVAQRTNEFGIRIALGARRGDLLRMVFKSVLGSLGAGIFTGVALSLALSHVIAKWAQGNPRDPGILLAGTILLGLVSGLACVIPARRASKVDPMIAVRCE